MTPIHVTRDDLITLILNKKPRYEDLTMLESSGYLIYDRESAKTNWNKEKLCQMSEDELVLFFNTHWRKKR